MDPITLSILAGGVTLAVLALVFAIVLAKSRPFTKDAPVFRASRLTSGNHVYPTQIAVYPDRLVRYSPRLIGHFEETISIRQVASVSISAGFLFSDVTIETTGGSRPVVCHGHGKRDAKEIERLVSEAQAKLR